MKRIFEVIQPLGYSRSIIFLSKLDNQPPENRDWEAVAKEINGMFSKLDPVASNVYHSVFSELMEMFPEVKAAGGTGERAAKLVGWSMYQKIIYEILSDLNQDPEITFLNLGYDFLDEPALELEAGDEINRYNIQLYHQLVGPVSLEGKQLLEVGCGRGGGCAYFARHFKPAGVIGMDFARANVAFAAKTYKSPGLSYIEGHAGALPFGDESIDVLLNLESSHCYPSMQDFLQEAYRVLKPGGWMLYADIRFVEKSISGYEKVSILEDQIAKTDFIVEDYTDITANVVSAITHGGEPQIRRWKAALAEAKDIDKTFLEQITTEVDISLSQQDRSLSHFFRNGEAKYLRYRLRKPVKG